MTEKELRKCCSIEGIDFPPFMNKTSILNHISTFLSHLSMDEIIERYQLTLPKMKTISTQMGIPWISKFKKNNLIWEIPKSKILD